MAAVRLISLAALGGLLVLVLAGAGVSAGTPAFACAPSSGGVFVLGDTTVTCSATDSAGNTATKTFTVKVRDTTPPVISGVPADFTSSNATVTYTRPTATDTVSGSVVVNCTPASGTTFAVGVTTVSCAATDGAGNTAHASFHVTVADTTPPVITVPADFTVEATSASGATVTYTATAVDDVDGPLTLGAPPPPSGCSSTISAGLQAAITAAPAGSTICLQAGSYGALTLTDVVKSSDVTIEPVAGVTASVTSMTITRSSHLVFDGTGGTLNLGGLDSDPSDSITAAQAMHDLTFRKVAWTGPVGVRLRGSGQQIVFDGDSFDNLGMTGIGEGRLTLKGYAGQTSGVVVKNSHFSGGCSDGVFVVGTDGAQVGPGNEFTGLVQTGCGPHVDPVQLLGTARTVITGNWFHNNGDGSGGIMAPDGGDHEQITYNVLVADQYPFVQQIGSHTGDLIAHNTYVGGSIEFAGHKTSPAGPLSTGQVVRNNVISDFRTPDPGTVEDHNLCPATELNCKASSDVKGAPVFVGGATPTSYVGYRLATGSPGKGSASDGTDIGIG